MKKRTLKVSASCALVLGLLLGGWAWVHAAADLDVSAKPFAVITIATGSAKKILLPTHDITIAHLSLQSDGSTASTAGDYIVIMEQATTMDATTAAGTKCIIFAGGSASFRGRDVATGADGAHEIAIQAVGHGATIQIIKGNDVHRNY